MVKRSKLTPQKLQKDYSRLISSILSLSDCDKKSPDPGVQNKLLERSKVRGQLEQMLDTLTVGELGGRETQHDISDCMEFALELGLFDNLAAFAQTDKPAGLLALVLSFYSRLIARTSKHNLMLQESFHRSVSSLLLIIGENMKKGVEFYQAEAVTLDFLQEICHRVHELPLLLEILLVKDGFQQEYLPIPILLFYFKRTDYDNAKIRELLLLCVQVGNREVMHRMISNTDFVSALACKLISLFRALPETVLFTGLTPMTDFSQELNLFLEYCRFLDQICEKCLWRDLLGSLSGCFLHQFCDRILLPRFSGKTQATTIYYLSLMVKTLNSPILLLPIVQFLTGKRPQEDSIQPQSPRTRLTHVRKFLSYDELMFSSGHTRNVSSLSTGISTPTKSPKMADVSVTYSANGRGTNPGPAVNTVIVWNSFLAYLRSPVMDDLKRMCLLLVRNLVRKGDWEIIKLMFTNHFKNTPKSVKISVTKESFLALFHQSTRTRVQTGLTPAAYFKAVNQFCESDLVPTEASISVGQIGRPPGLSEPLDLTPSDEENDKSPKYEDSPFQSPDRGHHERSTTTIIHHHAKPSVIQESDIESFSPGPLLESILSDLAKALSFPYEDMKLITVQSRQGVLEGLCRFPYVDHEAQVLFSYLVDSNPDYAIEERSLVDILVSLDRETEVKTSKIRNFPELYDFANSHLTKPRPDHSKVHSDQVSKQKKATLWVFSEQDFVLVRLRQGVATLDRFIRNLCSRIMTWETVSVVKGSCLEEWVNEMRELTL